MNDEEYFKQVAESKEWSNKTITSYKIAYKMYKEFCEKSFIELLDEAYQDEEEKMLINKQNEDKHKFEAKPKGHKNNENKSKKDEEKKIKKEKSKNKKKKKKK